MSKQNDPFYIPSYSSDETMSKDTFKYIYETMELLVKISCNLTDRITEIEKILILLSEYVKMNEDSQTLPGKSDEIIGIYNSQNNENKDLVIPVPILPKIKGF
jgi:hypothetical protein